MTLKEDIEKRYDALLALAKEYDSCFEPKTEEKTWGSPSLTIKEGACEKHWETRSKLELELAEWMLLLRKSLDSIPTDVRNYRYEKRTEPSYNLEWTEKVYADDNYSSLVGFLTKIREGVEGRSGVLEKIKDDKLVYPQLRDLRGAVLSFAHSLEVFVPARMVSIEQQVDIIFKLRELGLEKAAEEIEGIDEEEDNRLKCLKSRTALEQIISSYCEEQGVTPAKSFYHNLLHAIEKGMTEKEKYKSIAAHYSLVSKIVHGEMDANTKNTGFAIYGMFNIISSLILEKPLS